MLDDYVVYTPADAGEGGDASASTTTCDGGPAPGLAEGWCAVTAEVRRVAAGAQILALAAGGRGEGEDGHDEVDNGAATLAALKITVSPVPVDEITARGQGTVLPEGEILATVYLADADDVDWERLEPDADPRSGAGVTIVPPPPASLHYDTSLGAVASPDDHLLRHAAVWQISLVLRRAVAAGGCYDIALAGLGAAPHGECYPCQGVRGGLAAAAAAADDAAATATIEWSGCFNTDEGVAAPGVGAGADARGGEGEVALVVKGIPAHVRARLLVWVDVRQPLRRVRVAPVVAAAEAVVAAGCAAEVATRVSMVSGISEFPWTRQRSVKDNAVVLIDDAGGGVPKDAHGEEKAGTTGAVVWDLASPCVLAAQPKWSIEVETMLSLALDRATPPCAGSGPIVPATPLHAACLNELRKADSKLLALLLTAPAARTACPVDARDTQGRTALHYAARVHPNITSPEYTRAKEIVLALVELGKASVNAMDREGSTPLHLAAAWDLLSCDIVRLLLSRGAVPMVNHLAYTPLQAARACEQYHTQRALEEWQVAVTDDHNPLGNNEAHIRDHTLRTAWAHYTAEGTDRWITQTQFGCLRLRFVDEFGLGVGGLLVDRSAAKHRLFVDGRMSFEALKLVLGSIPRRYPHSS